MSPRHALLAVLAIAAIAGVVLLNRPSGDPLPEMADMPYAFITASAAGYDPARLTIVRGSSTPPRSVAVGDEIAWPAYRIDDPAVVPLRDGRPWIFPLIEGQRSPPLPPAGRVLSGPALAAARPYLTAEGEAMLQRFRERHGR